MPGWPAGGACWVLGLQQAGSRHVGKELLGAGSEGGLLRWCTLSVVSEGARRPLQGEAPSPSPHTAQHLTEMQQQELAEFAVESAIFHVLLVDDDPIVLKTVEQLLRKFGYKVTTALNGREAMQQLEASRMAGARPIDLMLTDILMPEVRFLSWQISSWLALLPSPSHALPCAVPCFTGTTGSSAGLLHCCSACSEGHTHVNCIPCICRSAGSS